MSTLQQQLAVTQAAAQARQGNLSDAAALLADIADPSTEVLDLLARIRAQQKRWADADALWARVQEVKPKDESAAQGRRMVAAIRARRRAARPVAPVVGAVVLVAAVVAGGAVWAGRTPDEPVAQAPAPVVHPTVDPRAAELARRVAQLEEEQRAAAAAVASQLQVIERQVAGNGVIVQRAAATVRVVFREGVFTTGTEFSPSGQVQLAQLGARLKGVKAAITVTGYSVVVPGSPSAGGSRTGLLRARVATQELSTASGLPLTAFAMQSGDQAHPPYRDDAKNRTVTVTLTPVTDR